MKEVTIYRRFCGPKNSGNGGYSCGMLGKHIDGPARARLNMPPPLDTPLQLKEEGGGVTAYHGDTRIGSAESAEVKIDLPPIPNAAAIKDARNTYLEKADIHLLPYCFVCGPKRESRDGLCIFAGAVKDSPVNADFWTPTDDLVKDDGLVGEEYLWAALDCPSFFALRREGGLSLLGSLTAEVKRRPRPGERLTVLAWAKGSDGRKLYADSALVDADGELVAAANAVWIELNDPAMLGRLKAENA